MKLLKLGLLISGLSINAGYAGCFNDQGLPAVGPAPAASATPTSDGSLQVYSARQKHDPSYLWDIFVGGANDDLQYDPAHTDYTIRSIDGKSVQKVRNARDPNDATPATVSLTPGCYLVTAEDRDYGRVTIAVVVKPGELTKVNLERAWQPPIDQTNKGEFVLLHGWRVVGWRAEPEAAQAQRPSLAAHP